LVFFWGDFVGNNFSVSKLTLARDLALGAGKRISDNDGLY